MDLKILPVFSTSDFQADFDSKTGKWTFTIVNRVTPSVYSYGVSPLTGMLASKYLDWSAPLPTQEPPKKRTRRGHRHRMRLPREVLDA